MRSRVRLNGPLSEKKAEIVLKGAPIWTLARGKKEGRRVRGHPNGPQGSFGRGFWRIPLNYETFRNCEKSKKQKNYINLQRIHVRTAGLLFYWGRKNYGMMDGIIDDERNH